MATSTSPERLPTPEVSATAAPPLVAEEDAARPLGLEATARFDWDPIERARRPRRRHQRRIGIWLAAVWLVLVVAAATFADLLPLHPRDAFTQHPPRTGVGTRLPEFLGTDAVGRSMLSRLIYGARISLLIGAFALLVSLVVGSALGLLAGYLRRRTDVVISALLDVMLAFPPLVLLLAVVAVLPRNVVTIALSLAFVTTPLVARLVRGSALALADREFVLAARAMGTSRTRIMLVEVFPCVVPLLVSMSFLFMAGIIIAEGSLSFLGYGIPAPTPTWGAMIAEGRSWLEVSPQLVLVPSIVLLLTIVALRTVGEALGSRFTGAPAGDR